MSTTFEITSIERAARPGAYSLVYGREVSSAREGWDARVTCRNDGEVIGFLHLDRIDGEEGWHISAEFGPTSSMPRYMLGLFSRCCAPTMAGPTLSAMLDEAAA